MRNSFVATFSLLALASCTSTRESVAASSGAPIEIHILAINDFHGNLEPPSSGAKVFNPATPREWGTVPAGGAPRR